ncbi:MAG: ribonuclease P protein subunit [Methanophagales archaeon]|nr:ribonuclease P protein subunit [Methanophagales archaeon]
MKITPGNLLQHELIGLRITVVESSNRNLQGLEGTVVDETRNMLVIEDERKNLKKIPKAGNRFIFGLGGGVRASVKGTQIVSRPEDRIKK